MTSKQRATVTDRRAAAAVTDDPAQTLAAVTTVLRFTLTEAFSLVGEETMWVGYHLDQILQPLASTRASVVPLTVRQELLDGTYSAALGAVESGQRVNTPIAADPAVTAADLDDWVAVIMGMLRRCYPLRPLLDASIAGQITGLLTELGVGDPDQPRGSVYLPSDVKERLARR